MRLLIVLCVLFGFLAPTSLAASQSSDETLSDVFDGIEADWDSWAAKYYQISGFSLTDPALFLFVGVAFDNRREAERGMEELPSKLESLFADLAEIPQRDFVQVSAGRIGDERYAASADIADDTFPSSIGYMLVRSSKYVVFGMTIGVMISPVITVAPYVEETLKRVEEADPSTSRELREELPQLDDMPIGYIDGDSVADETPTPKPTPTLTVAPTPPIQSSTSDHGFFLSGNGNYQHYGIALDANYYDVTFSCDTSGGKARIQWDPPDGVIAVYSYVTSPGTASFRLNENVASTTVSVMCAGEWSLAVRADD